MEKLNLVKSNFNEPPNNIVAEQAILGSILVSNEIFDDISPILNSKNFYDPMHQKIFIAIEKLIFSGMLANPITLKNLFENEKDELNIPDYLVKITKFSSSSRQTIEYSKLIYDLYVKRELIKISENLSFTAKSNDLNKDGKTIIEDTEKNLFDLAEKGNFNSSLIKFDEAIKKDYINQQSGSDIDPLQLQDVRIDHKAAFFDTMLARAYVGYGASSLGVDWPSELPCGHGQRVCVLGKRLACALPPVHETAGDRCR